MMADPTVETSTQALLIAFARSGVRELHVRSGDFELYLSNDPALAGGGMPPRRSESDTPLDRAAETSPPPSRAIDAGSPIVVPDDASIVRAPNLGTFYRAPKPGAADYVDVGSLVAVGDELCLIEVMKLFTTLRADADGRVLAILADDGAMVEAGQPLFAMTPSAGTDD